MMTIREIRNSVFGVTKILTIAATSLVAVLLLCPFTAAAQNNPYKINDELYKIYLKAHDNRTSTTGVAYSEEMYRKAVALGDKKAECLALTVPMLYAANTSNDALFEKNLKALQDKALQTDYVQYFYYGMTIKVNRYINDNKLADALQYLIKMQEYAQKHKHLYGIYTGYRNIALIHFRRGEIYQSLDSYKAALDFGSQYFKNQDMAGNYRGMAMCYYVLGEYQDMYDSLKKGLAVAKSRQAKEFITVILPIALYNLGKMKEFNECCDEAIELSKKMIGKNSQDEYYRLCALRSLANGDLEKAKMLIESISSAVERYRLLTLYYEKKLDVANMLECQRQILLARYKTVENIANKDVAVMNERYKLLELQHEKNVEAFKNTKLSLDVTRLSLINSELELGRSKTAEHLARLNADNYKLSFDNKTLEANRLKDSLESQKMRQQANESEMKRHNLLLMSLLLMATIIIVFSLWNKHKSRKYKRKLQYSNSQLRDSVEKLFVARDQAQRADRMKTMFLQNMSHEIRTPLNAIVGFSQVLTQMGDSFSDEEKAEMTKSINENTELLTTLIDDILDITSLESGKYSFKFDDVEVHDLCESAVKTVAHRVAPGVELKTDVRLPNPYKIVTDGMRVKQVLINFLTNAAKNTTEGSITLACRDDGERGMLVFSVTDTGIGVPKDKMKAIFERFNKLDRYKQGTGLGLSICQTIAEKLGGRIYIDENYTGGARFYFEMKIDSGSGKANS